MKKFVVQIIALLVLIFGGLYITQNPDFNNIFQNILFNRIDPKTNSIAKVNINQLILNVELADTPEKRAQGLADRDNLATDSGMLFIFDKTDKYKFWMKGMKFPLDFIWIKDDTIVDLHSDVQPIPEGISDDQIPILSPKEPINRLLEVNTGTIFKNNIKVGDKVRFQ